MLFSCCIFPNTGLINNIPQNITDFTRDKSFHPCHFSPLHSFLEISLDTPNGSARAKARWIFLVWMDVFFRTYQHSLQTSNDLPRVKIVRIWSILSINTVSRNPIMTEWANIYNKRNTAIMIKLSYKKNPFFLKT